MILFEEKIGEALSELYPYLLNYLSSSQLIVPASFLAHVRSKGKKRNANPRFFLNVPGWGYFSFSFVSSKHVLIKLKTS